MDMFAEYIVKRKKEAVHYIQAVLYVLAALLISVVIFILGIPFPVISSIVTLLIAGVWYGAVMLIKNKNIEYEYALTNGELDVDRIIARRKRKRILSVHCRIFEIFAPLEDEKYSAYKNIKTIDVAREKNSATAYFAVFEQGGEKTCLIFETSLNMRNIIKKYTGNRAFIRMGDDE